MTRRRQKGQKRKPSRENVFTGTDKKFMGVLLVVVALFFGNSLSNDYAFDDKAFISENQFVKQGFSGIPKILTTQFWAGYERVNQVNPSYRPLPLLTLAIETQIWGVNPTVNHFFNLLYYALTCIVLFLLLRLLLKGKWPYFPYAAALLFCVHPIHTEVVANVKGRDDLLALLGGLFALYALFQYESTTKRTWLIASVGTYFLGLLSKEHLLTWIALIPLTLYFFTDLKRKRILQLSTPFWIASVVFFLIRVKVIGKTVISTIDPIDNPILSASSFGEALATKLSVLFLIIEKLCVPYPLNSDYGFATITPSDFSDPRVYLSVLIYGGLLFLAITRFRQKRFVSFAILLFLLTIAPISNLFFPYVVAFAERALYTPSLGFILLVCSALYMLYTRLQSRTPENSGSIRTAFAILGSVILLAGGIVSFTRNPAWKNDITLFSTDIRTHPNSVKLALNYADALIDRNGNADTPDPSEMAEAKQHLDRAMELAPDLSRPHLVLGNFYKVSGDMDKAKGAYLRCAEKDPNNPVVHFNLGLMAQMDEDAAKAEEYYLKALEVFPNYATVLSNLGILYGQQNRMDECIRVLEKAFMISPDSKGAANLAYAYSITGNTAKASYYKDLEKQLD